MGVKIYWIVVALVILFGMILPQEGRDKRFYICIMAILHTFICGWHYIYLTGDLRKYAWSYYTYNDSQMGWFDDEVFHGGRNAGFQWISKSVSMLTDGDFHIFLVVLAVATQVAVAILIYKYSPKPWLSYLIWNCMAFYNTYDFTTIKQGLAMSFLMYAMIAIFEKRRKTFTILVLVAGFIHAPALIFLPAYFVANTKINDKTIIVYIVSVFLIYIYKEPIAEWATDFYYEDNIVNTSKIISLGGRFGVIVLIIICGWLLKGFRERRFESLFSLMVVAATIQTFSGYNNVFTRFADYYFQFVILFIPMIFYQPDGPAPINEKAEQAKYSFDLDSRKFFVIILTGMLILWYQVTNLGVKIDDDLDSVVDYRFQWEVQDEIQTEQYEEVKY